jgi:serine/threonine protein kinase
MTRALGRYELLRPLARGGMAEVYLARRRAAGVEKVLVVKRMRRERAGDARFLDLFVREAKLSMSLVHQNIVPVFDFGRIDDQVFLAMERVEGKDLGSSLAHAQRAPERSIASAGEAGGKAGRAGPLPPVLAAFVAAECCQALDYAHRRRGSDGAELGIVHRDVTPRNVLLSWSGEVKLTDFGIASLAGDDPTRAIGTPAYMAPEQARGEQVDPRADLYAVGLVLREAITGQRPRRGEDRDATLAAARANELDPWPASIDANDPLRAIADRATATDRDARYPDARAMFEELDAFIIAERAANKDERRAPARQLGAWLADVWAEDSTEISGDGDIDGGHLVSFIDDGALGVIGTGTARSMAATAGEDAATNAQQAPEQPKPELASAPSVTTSPTAVTAVPARGWSRPIAGAAAAALVAGGATWLVMSRSSGDNARETEARATRPQDRPPQPPIPPPQPPPDKRIADVVPPPPQPPHDDPGKSLARDSVGSAAPPPKQPQSPPKQPNALVTSRKQAGSATPPTPPTAQLARYRVTISTRPWSNFTIDGDPTQHTTPEQIELAPGVHRVHFTNPQLQLERDASFEVKDHDDKFFTDLQK